MSLYFAFLDVDCTQSDPASPYEPPQLGRVESNRGPTEARSYLMSRSVALQKGDVP